MTLYRVKGALNHVHAYNGHISGQIGPKVIKSFSLRTDGKCIFYYYLWYLLLYNIIYHGVGVPVYHIAIQRLILRFILFPPLRLKWAALRGVFLYIYMTAVHIFDTYARFTASEQ